MLRIAFPWYVPYTIGVWKIPVIWRVKTENQQCFLWSFIGVSRGVRFACSSNFKESLVSSYKSLKGG